MDIYLLFIRTEIEMRKEQEKFPFSYTSAVKHIKAK